MGCACACTSSSYQGDAHAHQVEYHPIYQIRFSIALYELRENYLLIHIKQWRIVLHVDVGHNWTHRWPHGLLLFFPQRIGLGTGNSSLDRTQTALWCCWLTWQFYLGVLCPVQAYSWWYLLQITLELLWTKQLHHKMWFIPPLPTWCLLLHLQIPLCSLHGRWFCQQGVWEF